MEVKLITYCRSYFDFTDDGDLLEIHETYNPHVPERHMMTTRTHFEAVLEKYPGIDEICLAALFGVTLEKVRSRLNDIAEDKLK